MTKAARSASKALFMLSVGLFFASLLTGQMHNYWTRFGTISNGLACVMFAALLVGSLLTLREPVYACPWMYAAFFLTAALFWDLSCFKCSVELNLKEQVNAWAGLVSLNGTFLCWVGNCLRGKSGKPGRHQARSNWRRYIPLAVICAAFAALFLLNYRVWFKMDSWFYYADIADRAGTWNFRFTDMKPLQPGGHACYAYAVLLTIGELLAPHFGIGQRAVNCALSIVTIVAFYCVAEKIWGEEKRLRCVLLTVIFAFSPLLYGISYLMSTDFPLLVYFTLLLAGAFYHVTFLKFIAILGVCFSKENGVFVLAFYYLGEVIASFAAARKKTVGGFFRELFSVRGICMYSGAFVYVLTLFLGSGMWAQLFRDIFAPAASAVEIPTDTYTWWHYPVFKIFEYFFMNFYWLIWPLLLIAVVMAAVHCRREGVSFRRYLAERFAPRRDYYIPILAGYVGFCVVGIAYFTYVHYRYVQLGHLFYVLSLGVIMDMMPKVTVKKELLLVPAAALLAIESFVLIDPVTVLFFHRFDAGNGELVTTRQYWYIVVDQETEAGYYWEAEEATMGQHYLAGGTEYSMETIGLQRVLEKTLERIGCSDDTLLVLDVFGGWPEYTCGQLFGVMDAAGWYWDPDAGTVVRYETDCPMHLAFDSDDLKPLMGKYAHVYYLDMPFNPYHANDVLKNYPARDSFSESCLRWRIDTYRLK